MNECMTDCLHLRYDFLKNKKKRKKKEHSHIINEKKSIVSLLLITDIEFAVLNVISLEL